MIGSWLGTAILGATVRDIRGLLPDPADGYRGTAVSYWILVGVTVVATARSLAHILLPDGGAGVIAGLDVDVEGGGTIVAMFAQWGLEQLLLAMVAWVAIVRYRFLVPFALLLQLADQVGRIAVGQHKPITVDSPPPGEIGSSILLPLAALALWFALPRRRPSTRDGAAPPRASTAS